MTISTTLTTYYSQNDEERILLENIGGINNGVILDIGAGDGRSLSNSLALIERGWSAVLVEPSVSAFTKLLDLHAKNERVKLVNAAIGTDTRLVKFYECADTLYSSLNPAKVEGKPNRSYWIQQITLKTLVAEIGCGPSVMSVDTEGSSFDILSTIPTGWDLRVIIVEHDGRMVEISGWGREHKYDVRGLNAENVVLVR